MNHPTPPSLRIKNRWFKAEAEHGPAEQAGAMAFIVWRVAVQMLKRMRGAGYEIDAGPAYFDFVREVLVFLLAVADRLAHARLDAAAREVFLVALVRHAARHLAENEAELLGAPAAGSSAYADRFIDLVNEVSAHYAEFGADPMPPRESDGAFWPDFGFVRYLGRRLEPTLPEHDRRWVLDQVMAIEAPEAVAIVQRSMRELFEPAARSARRSTMSGE